MRPKISAPFFILWAALIFSPTSSHSAETFPAAVKMDSVAVLTNIQYFGLGAINARDLEYTLPFVVGDVWQESFSQVARETIQKYYEKRGFYQTTVQVRTQMRNVDDQKNVALHVLIEEGPPCLVEGVNIPEPTDMEGVANRKRFQTKVLSTLGLQPGDRFDEEKLADQLRKVREFLSREDYILVNTDQVRLHFNELRTKVQVTLDIKYGERVIFGYLENTVFSKGELNDIVAQMKTTELGKDYVGALERRFVEEYKTKAYNQVKINLITRTTLNGKRVTFVFKEGTRTELRTLEFEGLSPPVQAAVKSVWKDKASRLLQRGYFVEKDLDQSVNVILDHLKSKGYLFAKLVGKTVLQVKNKNQVDVRLHFFEGDQTLVGMIRLAGFQHFSNLDVQGILGVQQQLPFDPFRFDEGLQNLLNRYRAAGFLNVEFLTASQKIVSYDDHGRKVSVELEVNEGTRFRIGHVWVKGLQKTKESVVRREIEFKEGDWYLEPTVDGFSDVLRKLGIFSDVELHPVASDLGPGYRDIELTLREADPGVIEFGPGFRSDLGFRLFAQAGYANLFGRNQSIILSGAANRRLSPYRFPEYSLQTTFADPRILDSKFGFTTGLNASKRAFYDFNASQTQYFASLDRRLLQPLLAKATYKLERIRQFGALSARDNQTLLIGTITPSLTLDTRDTPFNATKGLISTTSLELALPAFAAQSNDELSSPAYYKALWSTHSYVSPFAPKYPLVFANVLSLGYAANLMPRVSGTGSSATLSPIPLIKTFRLGGYSSIRGFTEDSINKDEFSIAGTLAFVNIRTQIDFPLVGELRFSPFLDAGNLFVDDRFIGSPFLRAAAGVGFRYVTPIGPVNFDYGFKLNRKSSESLGQFHFSVGVI